MAKKAGFKKLGELRSSQKLAEPRVLTSLPFRSDMLNLFTGGIKFGHVTEVSGNPGMFKSTLLAEVVGEALKQGAHVVVHDKERKLTADRFLTLGIENANKNNPKFWYKEDDLPEYILTLERMFEDMHEVYAAVRHDDMESIKDQFVAGEASRSLCKRYQHLNAKALPAKDKKTKGWQTLVSKKFMTPSQLLDVDKTPIVWIVDSVTSIPNQDEAVDPVTGKPNLKPSIAKNARVWSTLFQTCGFMDARVAALHIAQIRTAGIGTGRAYKKAAVPSANEFYATVRLKLFPAAQGTLFRDPKKPTEILIAKSDLSTDQKAYQIGRIIMASIDKNLDGVSTSVPIYMLNKTGTDVINSMFEFLHLRKMIVSAGGHYTWDEQFWPERAGETFRRAGFSAIYTEHGAELLTKLKAWKELISDGRPV